MAVPALPPSNTARYFYDYSVYGEQHALIARVGPEVGLSDFVLYLDGFLTEFSAGSVQITTVGLRHSEQGSNVTNPVDTTGLSSTYGTGSGDPINKPLQSTFTGRDGAGHKCRVGMFGWEAQTDTQWRYLTTDSSIVLACIASLESAGVAGVFWTINGSRPLWHPYMNVGYNDHWVKQERA